MCSAWLAKIIPGTRTRLAPLTQIVPEPSEPLARLAQIVPVPSVPFNISMENPSPVISKGGSKLYCTRQGFMQ